MDGSLCLRCLSAQLNIGPPARSRMNDARTLREGWRFNQLSRQIVDVLRHGAVLGIGVRVSDHQAVGIPANK